MKTFSLLLIFFSVISFQVSATVYTVNNTPGSNAHFFQLQPAHDAASPGDTLYVNGSTIQYDPIYISKRMTLIGPGFKPSNVDFLRAIVGAIYFYSAEASGSNIIGIQAPIGCVVASVDNIFITKSYLGGGATGSSSSNWTISNSFVSGNISGIEFATYRNNVIQGYITSDKSGIFYNVFINTNQYPVSGRDLIISNNIFYNTPSSFTLNSIFNNNIYYGLEGFLDIYINSDPNKPDSNSLSGNFTGENPQFVNVPINSFDLNYDYSLSESSVGKNASTDGTDIGIFGGEGFSITGEPSLPIVTTLLIKNAALEQNGELQVEIKGRANN